MYSIAACMGIHTYEALHKAGKHVEDVEVETDGERRPDYPKVYTKIMLKFRMKGPDLTDKDVRDAHSRIADPHLQHRRYGESGGHP